MWRRLKQSGLPWGLLWISPWIVGFLWFQVYPIVASLYYSFTYYNLMQPPTWVGLANYRWLLQHDDLFHQAVTNTLIFSLVSVPLDLAVALVFALLLNRDIPGRSIFRAAFYFPSLVPTVATSILWSVLFATQGGLINVILGWFNLGPVAWLSDPDWTMPSLVLLSVWGIGPMVVIFLAGLQDVPRTLYEAARIDGAGPLALVRHVTIPMLSPVILFNFIIALISALQTFDLPFIVFQNGGPLNRALLFSVRLFDVGFQQFQMGMASAMAWMLFIACLILSLVSITLLNRVVHYD